VNVTVIWIDEVLFVDDDLVIVYPPTKVFNIAVSPPSIRNDFCAGKYVPNGFFSINKLQMQQTKLNGHSGKKNLILNIQSTI
jgi:hypothetical protein